MGGDAAPVLSVDGSAAELGGVVVMYVQIDTEGYVFAFSLLF